MPVPPPSAPTNPRVGPAPAAPVGADELARRLQLITQAAGIGYWSLQGDAERAWWSEGLRALHGLAADEPVPTFGEWLRRWVHPDQQQVCADTWITWFNSPQAALEEEFQLRAPDGRWRDIAIHAMVERQGEHRLLLGVLIDVTAQRAAERSLHQAMAREALAVRAAGLGIWEVDIASQRAHWTDTMWTLRGLELQAEPPGQAARLELVHPDDREAMELSLARGDQAEVVRHHEFRVVQPDGQVRWLVSRSMTLTDEHGRPARRVGVNWDITALRQAELARQEREQAVRDNAAQSRLLSRLSHELRTPLNAVLGLSQLMLGAESGDDTRSRQRRDRLGQLQQAGQHLLALVDDALQLTELQADARPLVPERVPLDAVLDECVEDRRPALQHAQLRLQRGALDHRVRADRRALSQAMRHLLSFAIANSRPGDCIEVGAANRDGVVIVELRLGHPEMAAEAVERLFEPFGQPALRAQGVEDNGLGLYLARALVERMGGQLLVQGRDGEGVRFELRLPAAPAAPGAAERDGESVVLYIEDNAVNALIVKELLGMRGDTRVVVASDGTSGLALARSLRPHVILLDMQLPDFDGFEVLARLRQ